MISIYIIRVTCVTVPVSFDYVAVGSPFSMEHCIYSCNGVLLYYRETIARVTGGMKVKADRDEVNDTCCDNRNRTIGS